MRTLLALAVAVALFTMPLGAGTRTSKFVAASKAVLGNPHDIELSADAKLLYVSDVNKNRIAVLDSDTLELVATFGERELSGPHDIELGPDGKLYVADTHNHRIAIYEPDGKSAKLTGDLKGPFKAPEGVLAHPSGRIFVAGAWSDNLVVFENGKVVLNRKGYDAPHDIEVDAKGNIWLADANNNRVVNLTPDLKLIEEFKGRAFGFNGPRYLTIDPQGVIWVADKYTHRVLATYPGLRGALHVIGTGKAGKGPGKLSTPEGVASRGQDLWISDSSNNRVVRYLITD